MPSVAQSFALTGRVAIVTDRSRGVGREVAEGPIVFLAADPLNTIAGRIVVVDGGRTIA